MVAAAAVPTIPPPETTMSADVVEAGRCNIVFIEVELQDSPLQVTIKSAFELRLVWGRLTRFGLATKPNISIKFCRRNIFKLEHHRLGYLICLLSLGEQY